MFDPNELMSDPKYPIRQTIELYWDKTIQFLSHPIILVLLSVIITAIVTNWFLKRKEKQKAKRAFRLLWKSSKKLKYNDLSGRKEIKEKHPSTQAALQGEVDTLLKTNKNVLITSNSGAGKTHFTTNYLRRLNKAYILIPNADDFDKNYNFIPKPPKKARYKIILLDDFHTFFSTGILRLGTFIEHAIAAGYTIWANTITGDEFETIQNNMPPKLLSQFSELSIQANLGKEEAKRIAKAEGIEKLPDNFRGNIGDIFQDLIIQKARYKSLDGISRLILKVIKQLYMVGIYRPPFKMFKKDVHKLVKFYEPEISGEAITLKLDVLRVKEFILESKDPFAINFEENYLRTVVETKMKVKDFMTELSQIFPLNVATFTQAMQTATSYEDSVKIYYSMLEKKIQPNARPFNVLIRKAGDSDIGLTWLTEMDKFQLEPDEYTLMALLRTTKNDIEKMERVNNEMQKRGMSVEQPIADMFASRKIQSNIAAYNNLMNISGSYDKALMLFQEMNNVEIQPDVISYSILIKLSNDFETGMRLFEEMNNEKIKSDSVVYNTLINISNNFNKGLELLNKMQENGVSPDIYTLNTLLRLSDNFEKGESFYTNINILGIKQDNITVRSLFGLPGDFNRKLKLFEEMKSEGIKPDTSTYAFIIHVSDDLEKGMELLEQMKKEGIKPDASVYGTLINLSKDVDKGMELLNQMKQEGIKPDASVYGTLINLSKDVDKGMELLNQMKQEAVEPDLKVYGTLINLSNDFDKGQGLFNQAIEEGLKPDVEMYGTLINLSNDFDKGKGLFDQMIEDGLKPNVRNYGALINCSDDFDKGIELLNQMKKNGIEPNIPIYGTLINLSNDFDKGKDLFNQAIEEGLKPNNEIYGTLINRSNDFDKGMELLNQMKKEGVEPSASTYGTLIKLSNDVDKGMKLLNQMKNEGIKADNPIYGTLISISKNFDKGKELIDQMIEEGIRPDLRTYATLINLSKDYNNGKSILDQMIRDGIKPNVRIYTKLIQLSNEPQIGWKLLDEMISWELKPNVWTFNALIWLNKNNYQVARAILDEAMIHAKVKPDVVTYTQLMNISRNFQIASALLEEMVENGIQPNDRTFQVLKDLEN